MKQLIPNISLAEFQRVWLRCVSAMDTLVMEKGHDALILPNICARTPLSEQKILTCFLSLDKLLEMYDHLIVVEQAYKVKCGNEKPE